MEQELPIIPVLKPSMGTAELDAVSKVLQSGWIGLGPKVKEFEDKFAEYTTAKYVVGLNSGTAALDMAMKLLNIGPGDEVIVPTVTFVSTAHAVAYQGATPVFADCDRDTYNINLDDVIQKVTPKTKAVIVVHHGGRPIALDTLRALLPKEITIVEDCAHAAGSYYKDMHVGTQNIGCFSFHAVKNLAMGEGGAITLPDEELFLRAKKLRWLGIDKGTWDRTALDKSYWWEYAVDEIGLKSHLNDIHASIGLVQLERLKELNRKRKFWALTYHSELKVLEEQGFIIRPLTDDEHFSSSHHLYVIRAKDRDALSLHLKDRGVSTGVHYKPIHLYKCYGDTPPSLPVAEELFKEIISLPLFPDLQTSEALRVINGIKEFYETK